MSLSVETKGQLKEIIQRSNVEPGSAIPILQEVQNRLGHVSPEMIEVITEETGIPSSDLYGIVTFYAQFHLEPRGRHLVRVCHGTACHLAGAGRITHAVEMATGAREGHTSPDRQFTHERVACLGCCSLAPVVMVNEDVHANVRADRVGALMRKYKGDSPDAKGNGEAKSSAGSI